MPMQGGSFLPPIANVVQYDERLRTPTQQQVGRSGPAPATASNQSSIEIVPRDVSCVNNWAGALLGSMARILGTFGGSYRFPRKHQGQPHLRALTHRCLGNSDAPPGRSGPPVSLILHPRRRTYEFEPNGEDDDPLLWPY